MTASAIGPAEGSGAGLVLAYLVVAVVLVVVLGPLALLVGRDAKRRGRNAWAWGLLFFWQPVIVGIVYLIIRRRAIAVPPPPAGWYPDPSGRMHWWDGNIWTGHITRSSDPQHVRTFSSQRDKDSARPLDAMIVPSESRAGRNTR